MSNFLKDGTILPFGLLGSDTKAYMGGFNRMYKNTPLRVGVITNIYAKSDPGNLYHLTTEYDVSVMEQNENTSVTMITYAHCMASDGLGSLADFFEKNFRPLQQNKNPNNLVNLNNQNGAVVLILCLDAVSYKGIIIGGFNHPNRDTTLLNNQPYLQGEYNGVNIVINNDGSTALTFNGATDNNGEVIDSSQGTTTVAIATDGSFSVQNAGGTVEIQKSGTINITCTGPANIIAQGVTTVDGSHINLGQNASHALILGDLFQTLYNAHTHATVVGPTSTPIVSMTEQQLSQKSSTE